ncbi:BON domain-containing protein [Roseovarius spongiae]|uniref:BON domain-containing protein n=1 Tax=Roseovarius spongiae TaxID=2320272 RepID=A0A3A8B3Y4_9RHOB|nr:BON domain-containing protein [Roseovarius spongiae]RKF12644.1 BON domain-containing protein [Roseovarius spongiae]
MARRLDQMTEEEARAELARRNHPRERHEYPREDERAWREPGGDARGALFGAGYGWPYLPPPYPGANYDPYAMPEAGYGPSAPPHWGGGRRGMPPQDRRERDMFDRAGDEIASWFGDEAAEARREADHRGRGPKGYVRSDARIEEDVHDRLTDDAVVDATEISVSVQDREVTLDGTVDSRRAKRGAEDCVDSVSGVQHVQNNLRVQPVEAGARS